MDFDERSGPRQKQSKAKQSKTSRQNLHLFLHLTTLFVVPSQQSQIQIVATISCFISPSFIHFSCLVTQSCPTLRDPMDCSMPGFPVLHNLLEFVQTHGHWVNDAIQPSHPLSPPFLLPSIFPSIEVSSNELVLHISWPKYWSFSNSPSNEYSTLISFRIDCFDLLAVQGTLKSLL